MKNRLRKFFLLILMSALLFSVAPVYADGFNAGWVKDNGITYYYNEDGTMAKGFQVIEGKKYYFYSTGGMASGWLPLWNTKFYFNADGTMATGFQTIDNKRYYFFSTGGMARGWLDLPGAVKYYFNSEGVMVTGRQLINEKEYLFSLSGELISTSAGWLEDRGIKYYYKEDGTFARGWETIDNKKYYFYSSGGMAKGWLNLPGGRKYYLDSDGSMARGFRTIGDNKHYFYSTGGMATGWLPLPNNRKYYFNSSGAMITNDVALNGNEYSFFSDGQLKSTTSFTDYDSTINEVVDTNLNLSTPAQTDKYRNEKTYVHSDYVDRVSGTNTGVVNVSTSLNVREGPGTDFWKVGSLRNGQTVTIYSEQGDWYEISYGAWKNAKPEDIEYYVNPINFNSGSSYYYQFLDLSKHTGISAKEINDKILYNKGVLKEKGQAFIDGANQFNVNEVYLISHALLETGNGSSDLATGVLVSEVDGQAVEPKVTHNMYGIGAYDGCALKCGSEYAYKQGWFTPEEAIIGGAKFIGDKYINHSVYKQDTLYKMRWNPNNPGIHQYATDIGWATKQVWNMYNMYQSLERYTLKFDVPNYK